MAVKKIEISYKTIVFTVIFLLSLALLWYIRNIILLLFVSFILMEALNPYVSFLEKHKVPRPIAIVIIYLVILAIVAVALAGIVPVFVEQTAGLIDTLPRFIEDFNLFGFSASDLSTQLRIIESLPANIARAVLSVFSNLFSAFVLFVVTYYLLLERKRFPHYSLNIFGADGQKKTDAIISILEQRLGHWVNAEFFLMTIIGLLSYIGYTLLGLNYAVPLAIIAGLLEIVPNIGPTIATTLAALIGLTVSPITALLAVAWGILIQQLENNIIVPKIMKETVGINPLVTIVLLITGARLAGVIGSILAIPVYITVEAVIRILYRSRKK